MSTELSEHDLAVHMANRILERPNADPDDDLSILSRQLLRRQATIQQLEARIVSLETDVDRMAWKTSPATAQATIDQLVTRNNQLEVRVKELEAIAPPCRWYQDGDGEDRWMTACSRIFCLNEGTPSENKMSWCCYCGGKLEEHLDTAPESA